ncbi:MAG: hypothetical protein ABL994_00010 [Verrucomicrobiales bacterium]
MPLNNHTAHADAKRAKIARDYNELLSAAGFGWMGWALREGKSVSTCRDRYDGNGINGEGFPPFFTKVGKRRRAMSLAQPSTEPRKEVES